MSEEEIKGMVSHLQEMFPAFGEYHLLEILSSQQFMLGNAILSHSIHRVFSPSPFFHSSRPRH